MREDTLHCRKLSGGLPEACRKHDSSKGGYKCIREGRLFYRKLSEGLPEAFRKHDSSKGDVNAYKKKRCTVGSCRKVCQTLVGSMIAAIGIQWLSQRGAHGYWKPSESLYDA